MAVLALVLYLAYLTLAFGVRTAIQLRRTGATEFHGLGGRPGSPEWIAGVGVALALVLGVAAPVLALLDVVGPITALDTTILHVAGVVLAMLGIVATFLAQVAMGTSWADRRRPRRAHRAGHRRPVRARAQPDLRHDAPDRAGPDAAGPKLGRAARNRRTRGRARAAGRVIEEPYLGRVHGEQYRAYAQRVGRFLPGVGRL